MTGIARRGPSIRLTRAVMEIAVLTAGWILGGTLGIGTLAGDGIATDFPDRLLNLLSVRRVRRP